MSFFDDPDVTVIRKYYGFVPDILKFMPHDGCLLIFNCGRGHAQSFKTRAKVESTALRKGRNSYVCDLYVTSK